jgi:hypothetical protein
MVNNEDNNNHQQNLTCKVSFQKLFTHRGMTPVLWERFIGWVFVINFSLRNTDDGNKLSQNKQNLNLGAPFRRHRTELQRRGNEMIKAGGKNSERALAGLWK